MAIATYQGAAYITEQLESILKQTVPISEIIIVDDASKDHTITTIKQIIHNNPTSTRIRLIGKTQNSGSTESFAQAIAECHGEWIALADQDDIWRSDKIELLLATAEKHNSDAVFSDATLVDADLHELGKATLWQTVNFGPSMQKLFLNQKPLAALLRYNVITGATLLFRSHVKDLVLPIPKEWVHDYWIALLIAATGDISFTREALIFYRQHQQNQIGSDARSVLAEAQDARNKDKEAYLAEASQFQQLHDRLSAAPGVDPNKLHMIEAKIAFLQMRFAIRDGSTPRLASFWAQVRRGAYFKYGRGWKTLMKDLLM